MQSAGISDRGRIRPQNEDSIFLSDSNVQSLPNLYIVADGMGGHKAGEIASNYAICTFVEYLEENKTLKSVTKDDVLDVLVSAFQYANGSVYSYSIEVPEYEGMGTTFTLATILNEELFICHVGDSRLYLFEENELRQITEDDSLVMEMVKQNEISIEAARVHPNRNLLTKALGTELVVKISTYIEKLTKKTTILICSDGLSNCVSELEMGLILASDDTLKNKCESLVKTANENGGFDNISVILINGGETTDDIK